MKDDIEKMKKDMEQLKRSRETSSQTSRRFDDEIIKRFKIDSQEDMDQIEIDLQDKSFKNKIVSKKLILSYHTD